MHFFKGWLTFVRQKAVVPHRASLALYIFNPFKPVTLSAVYTVTVNVLLLLDLVCWTSSCVQRAKLHILWSYYAIECMAGRWFNITSSADSYQVNDCQNAPHISVAQMNYYHQTLIENYCLLLKLKVQRGFFLMWCITADDKSPFT